MHENRKELVEAFFQGKDVDRVPVAFWWHYFRMPPVIAKVKSLMKSPSKIPPSVMMRLIPTNPFGAHIDDRVVKASLAGHKRDYTALRPDFVKIMSDGFFSHPSIVDNSITKPEDLSKVTHIDPNHPWIRRQVDYVKELTEFFNGEVMSFYTLFTPIQQFRLFIEYLVGDVDGFQSMLLTHKEELDAAAHIIGEDTIMLAETLKRETDIDGIFYSVQSPQRPEVDHEHQDKWIKPTDLMVLNKINDLWDYNILHVCGYEHYRNDLHYYASYPCAAYNWAVHTEGVSLAEGKEIFDGVVIGGFDNNPGSLIDKGTTAEVFDETQRMIKEAGKDRLALGADCTIPTPNLDRLEVIRLAAELASRD